MKRFIQFGDPLLEKVRMKYLYNWILLLILNVFPQVSYRNQADAPTTLVGFTRIILYSILLLMMIYSWSYFSYMIKKYKKDVLLGSLYGLFAGVLLGVLCVSMTSDFGVIVPGSLFGIIFATLFGTYAWKAELIPPAAATAVGVITAAVSTTIIVVYPLAGKEHLGFISAYGFTVLTICLVMNAFFVSLPAFIKATRKERAEIDEGVGYPQTSFFIAQ